MIKKIVLAYSGGLDTSVAIHWLREQYGAEVIGFCADLGQGEDLKHIKEKALKTEAAKVYIKDLKKEFVRDYIFPMLRANAVYEGSYLLGTSIARPLIAKSQIEIAEREGAEAIAHGATGKGNDQVRFELSYYALKPKVKVIAPWREWPFRSRQSLIDYAKQHGIPVTATAEKPYSIDRNLFHISYEGGILEDPWQEPPADLYTMITPPEKAPDKPLYIEISYKKGDPVALNNEKMSPEVLIKRLNFLAGKHGVGRIDIVENRYVGMKSRGVYETPGGTVLHLAHKAMESITLDREIVHLRDSLVTRYADLIYNGYWFSPERQALQTLIDDVQSDVTGTVRIKLYKGNCYIVGRKAPHTLYNRELATFEAEDVYNQRDADGFIKLNALRLRLQTLKKGKEKRL